MVRRRLSLFHLLSCCLCLSTSYHILPPNHQPPNLPSHTAFTVASESFMPFTREETNHLGKEIAQDIGKDVGKHIVLSVSGNLPKFDSVGHKILSANHNFISDILNNEFLSPELKKDVILASIKMAQMGDDMGSHILQMYYDLVDACL